MKSPSEYATAVRQFLGIERFETADGVQAWAGHQVSFRIDGSIAFGIVESFEDRLGRYVVILRDVYVFDDRPNGFKVAILNTDVYRYWVRA